MHLSHILQCSIKDRNMHISNGVLWDIKQMHSEICEIALLEHLAFITHLRYQTCIHQSSSHKGGKNVGRVLKESHLV